MALITSTTSSQFTLKINDIVKGLVVAIITPVFTIILTSLNAGVLTFNWKIIAATAVASGLSYLLKNFFTPAQVVITNKEAVESIKAGESLVKVVDTPLDGKVGTTGVLDTQPDKPTPTSGTVSGTK